MRVTKADRRRIRSRRGVTAVETALVLIPLLTFILGIFEYGRFFMVLNLASNACREGARYAVVHTYDKTTAQVQAMFAGQDQNLQGMTIQLFRSNPATGTNLGAWTDAKFGEGVTVQVNGTYRTVVPSLLLIKELDRRSGLVNDAQRGELN